YNASIADGYTLRLIREEIATNYRMILQQALKEVEVRMGDVDRKYIYAHPSFVKPMLNYIVTDFAKSRGALNYDTIGGMVICDSSEQAKQMFEIFNTDYAESPTAADEVSEEMPVLQAAEPAAVYHLHAKESRKIKRAALILHDIGSKQERKE
ncbi:type I restriction endonuclease subunit R, partial [Pseudomonas aeruginosa]